MTLLTTLRARAVLIAAGGCRYTIEAGVVRLGLLRMLQLEERNSHLPIERLMRREIVQPQRLLVGLDERGQAVQAHGQSSLGRVISRTRWGSTMMSIPNC